MIVISQSPDGDYKGTAFGIINSAIATVASQGGGTVFLRRGIWTPDPDPAPVKVIVLFDNVTLQGEGPGTILRQSFANWHVIQNSYNSGGGVNQNITVRDLQVDGGTVAVHGISLASCIYSRIENVIVSACSLDGIYVATAYDIDILNCRCSSCQRNGIGAGSGLFESKRVRIARCTVSMNANYGIDLEPVGDSVIDNCYASNSTGTGGGIAVLGEPTHGFPRGNVISNCQVLDNPGPGIVTSRTDGCLITGCISSRNSYGIMVPVGTNSPQIVGNQVVGNEHSGIHLFEGAARAVISGNLVAENGQYGINAGGDETMISGNCSKNNSINDYRVYDGIRVAGSRATVTGNQAIDTSAEEVENLTANVSAGSDIVRVADVGGFFPNQYVTISEPGKSEDHQVKEVATFPGLGPDQIRLKSPLANSYSVTQGAKIAGRASQLAGIILRGGGKHVVTANVAYGNSNAQIVNDTQDSIVEHNMTT